MKELMDTSVSPNYYTMAWLMAMQLSLNSNGGTYSNVDMDYCVELWQRLMYEISWVAHYAIDMVSNLAMDWH
jgi:hypothetical protein